MSYPGSRLQRPAPQRPARLWDRLQHGEQARYNALPSCLPVRPLPKPIVWARKYGALSEDPSPALAARRAKTRAEADSAVERAKRVARRVVQRRETQQAKRRESALRRVTVATARAATEKHFSSMQRALDALADARRIIGEREKRQHEEKFGLLPQLQQPKQPHADAWPCSSPSPTAAASSAVVPKRGDGRNLKKLLQGKARAAGAAALLATKVNLDSNYTSRAARAFLPRSFDARHAARGVKLLRSARLIQAAVRVQQAAAHRSATRLQATYRKRRTRGTLADAVRRRASAERHWSDVKQRLKVIHGAHTGEDLISGSTPACSRPGSASGLGRNGRKKVAAFTGINKDAMAIVVDAEFHGEQSRHDEQVWSGNYRVGGRLVHISIWFQEGLPTLDVRMMCVPSCSAACSGCLHGWLLSLPCALNQSLTSQQYTCTTPPLTRLPLCHLHTHKQVLPQPQGVQAGIGHEGLGQQGLWATRGARARARVPARRADLPGPAG